MLKKMGIGLFCCLVKGIVVLVIQAVYNVGVPCSHFDSNAYISCYFFTVDLNINNACVTVSNFTDNLYHCHENDTPFLLLLIPNILQGLLFLLVFMTVLEFICAQAPLRLKGLLIGIWYALLATHYILVEVAESFTIDNISWIVAHMIMAFLIFISLILYLCVSERYRYRLRDEVVNERFLVEEIYEREFNLAEQYERDKDIDDELSNLVESVDNCRSYGTIQAM